MNVIPPMFTVIAIFVMGTMFGALVAVVVAWLLSERRHREELLRFANMLSSGSPVAEDPEIINAPPDAIARARERIRNDRIENGIAVLKDKYAAQGLSISDEEAKIQVEAMLVGNSPV